MRYLLAAVLFSSVLLQDGAFAQSRAHKAKTQDAIETLEMTAYRRRIDKAFLESGVDISVTVQTKCPKREELPGYPAACPALSFLGKYIDRPMSYALVTKILNSLSEARELGFKNVVIHGLNPSGSRYTFDLRKPSPTCSGDLCF